MEVTCTLRPTPYGLLRWVQRHGWTIGTVSRESGISHTQLWRWIRGEHELSARNGDRLLGAMRRLDSAERRRTWRSGTYPEASLAVAEAGSVSLWQAPRWLESRGYPRRSRQALEEAIHRGTLEALVVRIGQSNHYWIRPEDLAAYVQRTERQRRGHWKRREQQRGGEGGSEET